MERADMDRLVARAKERARLPALNIPTREAVVQAEKDSMRAIERLRIARLQRIIDHWLETMAAADHPGDRQMQIETQTEVVKRGLFGSRVEQHFEYEDVVGWHVCHRSTQGEYEKYPTLEEINLLADGRLIDIDSHIYHLGTGAEKHIDSLGNIPSLPTAYSELLFEESIPGNLQRLAAELGVAWNPDESITGANPAGA